MLQLAGLYHGGNFFHQESRQLSYGIVSALTECQAGSPLRPECGLLLAGALRCSQLRHHLVEVEAGRLLPDWELLEARQPLRA